MPIYMDVQTVPGKKLPGIAETSPPFRTLLVTSSADPFLLKYAYGTARANELLYSHNCIIKKNISLYSGNEAEHIGSGFIIIFNSTANALACALAIQREMTTGDREALGFSMAIHAGEVVENGNRVYGDAIQLAFSLCGVARHSQIAISSRVRELISREIFQYEFLMLSPYEETLLQMLFNTLSDHWQDAAFDVNEFCRAMAMSTSRLYRHCVSLTGCSPNILLKKFRLEKAKELMRKQRYNISQITFESGFTCPSYFTKCFKKRYGLLPMNYIDLLH